MSRKLCGTGERCRKAAEIECRGRHPIGSEAWIPVAERDHAPGFAADDEPGHGDAVAADVHERAAAGIRDIANVLRVHVEVREECLNRPHLTDRALADELARTLPLWMEPVHEGFHHLQRRTPRG